MTAVAIERVLDYRGVLALSVSGIGGAAGLRAYPVPADHAVLALVHLDRPLLFAGATYIYAALWFSSSFFPAGIGLSRLYLFVGAVAALV